MPIKVIGLLIRSGGAVIATGWRKITRDACWSPPNTGQLAHRASQQIADILVAVHQWHPDDLIEHFDQPHTHVKNVFDKAIEVQ